MSAELVAVAAALFGGADAVGPMELEATREILARHNLAAADVVKWLAVRSVMPLLEERVN